MTFQLWTVTFIFANIFAFRIYINTQRNLPLFIHSSKLSLPFAAWDRIFPKPEMLPWRHSFTRLPSFSPPQSEQWKTNGLALCTWRCVCLFFSLPPSQKKDKNSKLWEFAFIVACVLAGEGPVRAPILFEARIREDSRALGSSGDHKKTTRWSPTRFYFLPEIFERGWCSVRRARAFVCEFSSVFLWLNLGMFAFKFWCSFEVFGWCVSRRLFFEAHFLVRLVLAVGSYRVTYVCMYVYFLWCIIYFVYSFYLSFCLVLTFLEIDIPFILHRSLMIRIDNDENSAEIKKNLSFNFEEWGYVILVIVS